MAAKKSGLGRGLDALFADNSMEESSGGSIKLKIYDIEPNRDQPRKEFDEKALSELADSIARHGIIQPLIVRPLADGSYQLVAGERRWRAARIAGLTEVPVVVRELSDRQTMELALIENLQREDLNAIEEAEGLRLLMDTYHFTQEEVSEVVGKSRPAIANSLRLLNLPEKIRELTRDAKLSPAHARTLLSFSDIDKMLETAAVIIEKGLSVRETEKLAKAAAAPQPKREKRRDVFFSEVEIALANTMGRKVKVTEGKKKGSGKIELEFFDRDDLVRIAALLDSDN